MFIKFTKLNTFDDVYIDPDYIMKVDRGDNRTSLHAYITLEDGSNVCTVETVEEVIDKINSATKE